MTIPALTKPVNELNADDICMLVEHKIREGENVEFKRGLSSSKGSDSNKLTKDAKKAILKEIVAFANGYGGRIFLGVQEDDGEPDVAAEIVPIADCAELARRIERICGDSIEPPLLRMQTAGIVTDGNGSGVVALDVPRSTRAPHRSKADNQCYRRRGSESVPMDMREIQDMTFRSANRLEAMNRVYETRKLDFNRFISDLKSKRDDGLCFRMTFVPVDELDLGHVHGNRDITPENLDLRAWYKNNPNPVYPIPSLLININRTYIPVLRGTKFIYDRDSFSIDRETLWSDGVLEVLNGFAKGRPVEKVLYLNAVVHWLANGLRNIERIRRYAGTPTLEYGLEVQLVVFGNDVKLIKFLITATADRSQLVFDAPELKCGNYDGFPRYRIGAIDEFNDAVNLFIIDWLNNAEIEAPKFEIEVDYELT